MDAIPVAAAAAEVQSIYLQRVLFPYKAWHEGTHSMRRLFQC